MNDLSIKFNVTPSFPHQINVELTLCKKDDEWILHGQFGSFYSREDVERNISLAHAEKILSQLNDIKLPLIPYFSMGLDGTTYQLELKNGFNSLIYCWWEKSPQQYAHIKQFCNTLLFLAEIKMEVT